MRTPFPKMAVLLHCNSAKGSCGLGTMCCAVDLEVLKRSGSDSEKRHAVRIMPVIEKQHLLLVTLLLVNAAAMEALPIFIDKVCPRSGAWPPVLHGNIQPRSARPSLVAIGTDHNFWCSLLILSQPSCFP